MTPTFRGERFVYGLKLDSDRARYDEYDTNLAREFVDLSKRLEELSPVVARHGRAKHGSWFIARLYFLISDGMERIEETIKDVCYHQSKYPCSFTIKLTVEEDEASVGVVAVKVNNSAVPWVTLHVSSSPGVEAGSIADDFIEALAAEPESLTICRYMVQNMSAPSQKPKAFGWDGKKLL